MQAPPNSGNFYTFAELQALKPGDLVIFAHGYLNGRVAHLQPEFVWAFVRATRFEVWFKNIARVQADGLIIEKAQAKLSESDYRSSFARSARPPTLYELRIALRDRENIRVGAIEERIKELKRLAKRFALFDELGPYRESHANNVKFLENVIARFKRQRRLAIRRLRYRIRQTEEYPS